MAILEIIDTLPATTQDAITVFNERYVAAAMRATAPGWVDKFGDVIPLDSPATVLPLSFISSKYVQARDKAGGPLARGAEKGVNMNVAEFTAGTEAPWLDLKTKSFAYAEWLKMPAIWQEEERQFRAEKVGELLNTGSGIGSVCGWDDLAFFHDSHLRNPKDAGVGTFDNLQATAKTCLDVDNLAAEMALQQQNSFDVSGRYVDTKADTVATGLTKALILELYLAKTLIANTAGTAGISNTVKLSVEPIPQLSDADDWILIDSKRAARMPGWISGKYDAGAPFGLRIFDESSDFFKETSRLKTTSHIHYAFTLMYPHAFRLVRGA